MFGLLCDVPMTHVVARSFFNARDQVLAANKSEIGNRVQVLGKAEAKPSLGRVCRSSQRKKQRQARVLRFPFKTLEDYWTAKLGRLAIVAFDPLSSDDDFDARPFVLSSVKP